MKNAINVTRFLCVLSITTFFYTACDKDDKVDNKPEQKTFPIKNIKGSSGIDLSGRNDWSFFLGDKEYVYKIDDSVITATPKDKPYNVPYKVDNSGNVLPISEQEGLEVRLFAKDYYYPGGCGECPPKPNVKDQSTVEKFHQADMLYGRFSGIPSSDLTGIRLKHYNALLDFNTKDMPADAVITVATFDQITPLADAADHYKAVVVPSTIGTPIVRVTTADTTYNLEVKNESGVRIVMPDMHYRFTLRFDQQAKRTIIENLSGVIWSEE